MIEYVCLLVFIDSLFIFSLINLYHDSIQFISIQFIQECTKFLLQPQYSVWLNYLFGFTFDFDIAFKAE